jgi:rfaE bifunctional protein kinase chain/domain
METELPAQSLRQLQRDLKTRIALLEGRKVLVLGDIGLDEYVIGDVKRISPEAPVPVLEVYSEDKRLGLAANVAQNVASLGGFAQLVAVVGDDGAADKLRQLLTTAGVDSTHLVTCNDRPTTRKLRVIAEQHHIVRVDYEHRKFLQPADEERLVERVRGLIEATDIVILEDYGKGVFSQNLAQKIIRMAHDHGKKVLLDPHPKTPIESYRGVDLMTPNRDEAVALSGVSIDDLREHPQSLLDVGHELLRKVGSENLVITRGKEGMSLFSEGKVTRLPTYARQVFDVTGAGDTVIAALGLAMAAGLPLVEACVLANFAAGVVVSKVGCVPCSTKELSDYVDGLNKFSDEAF